MNKNSRRNFQMNIVYENSDTVADSIKTAMLILHANILKD